MLPDIVFSPFDRPFDTSFFNIVLLFAHFSQVAAAAAVPGSTNLLLNLLSFSTLAESRNRLFGGGDLVLQAVTRKREEEEEEEEERARLKRENLSGGGRAGGGGGKKGTLRNFSGSLRNMSQKNKNKIHSSWKSLRQKMKRGTSSSSSSRNGQGGWSVDSSVRSKQRMVVDKGLEVSVFSKNDLCFVSTMKYS